VLPLRDVASKAAEAGERARQRKKREARAADPRRKRMILLAWILGVAAIVGVFAFASQNAPPAKECPDHWHATFAVFVRDTQVQFDDPAFYDNSGGHHMHGNDGILHTHASGRCIPLSDMMRKVGVTLTDTTLTLAPEHSAMAGTYSPQDGQALRLYHQAFRGQWREVSWTEMSGEQLGNGDKWLIHYGAGDPATIAAQQASVPDLPPQYAP
jgi:hypothetical protein